MGRLAQTLGVIQMPIPATGMVRYQRYFIWCFACSLIVLFVSAAVSPPRRTGSDTLITRQQLNQILDGLGGNINEAGLTDYSADDPAAKTATQAESPPPNFSLLISIASLTTSSASLLAFCITGFVSLRKERREGRHSYLDIEKKKLELEKLRRELDSRKTEIPRKSRNYGKTDA